MQTKTIIALIFILCLKISVFSQKSFLIFVLPSKHYYINVQPKPDYFDKDSLVYNSVLDDMQVLITIKDSLGKHKDLVFKLTIQPFSINQVIIKEQNRRKLKIDEQKTIFYLPKIRCKKVVSTAFVERSIVDFMLIEREGARMKEVKKFIRNYCLKYSQVKALIMMFTSDKQRLELAKYAYFFVKDHYNYFILRDAFRKNTSFRDFQNFVKGIESL